MVMVTTKMRESSQDSGLIGESIKKVRIMVLLREQKVRIMVLLREQKVRIIVLLSEQEERFMTKLR